MDLDIRLPIGLMFSTIGVLLAGYGLFGDKTVYAKSLGINVNLGWGAALIGFGLVMLFLSLRRGRRA
jgi:hypothetical protein